MLRSFPANYSKDIVALNRLQLAGLYNENETGIERIVIFGSMLSPGLYRMVGATLLSLPIRK